MEQINKDSLLAFATQYVDTIIPTTAEHRVEIDTYIDMLITQHQTNCSAAGLDWVERATVAGQKADIDRDVMPLDYRMAAFYEASAELLPSACPYEWWRDKSRHKVDIDNSKMEMVDVLHFILSLTLVKELENVRVYGGDSTSLANETPYTLTEVAHAIVRSALLIYRNYSLARTASGSYSLTPASLSACSFLREQIIWMNSHILHQRLGAVWQSFWSVGYAMEGFTGDGSIRSQFVLLYQAKAALNVFRYANGYKEGSYLKVWADGREDNAHLQDVLTAAASDGKMPTKADFLEWLSVNYQHQKTLLGITE